MEQNRSMMKAPLTPKQMPTLRSGSPAQMLPEPFGAVALGPAADAVPEALPVGLFQIDSARHVVYANDRFHEIVGVERANGVEAQLSTVIEADRPALEKALDAVLGRGLPADIEVELKLSHRSKPRFCTMNLRALSDEAGTVNGAIVCVADVTDAARMRRRSSTSGRQSIRSPDALTGRR